MGNTNTKIQKISDIYLLAREKEIIPGPHRIQRLLGEEFFNLFQSRNIPTILVGGTNGKGSTCAFLESIFRNAGFKTGLYTSPHLISPTERIRISNIPISENLVVRTLSSLDKNRKNYLKDASFFELMTASAIKVFYNKKVDVIISEVGLGGKLDSTNVLAPTISVLTSVNLDHMHILGKTITKIARDKAFISRRNRQFVVNGSITPKALDAVFQTVKTTEANIHLTSHVLPQKYENLLKRFETIPYYCNLRTAITAFACFENQFKNFDHFKKLQTTEESLLENAIRNTYWPGRFDIRQLSKKKIIFDCAHNIEGVKLFLDQYDKSIFSGCQYHLIFASLKDKTWKKNIELLAPRAKTICITECNNDRAEQAISIANYSKKKKLHSDIDCIPHLQEAVRQTLLLCSSDPIVIIGSVAFIGNVFESLKLDVFKT